MVVAINLVYYPSICHTNVISADRKTREATTAYPEIPQSDMSSVRPEIDEKDPCFRFSIPDFNRETFYSPRLSDDDKTYTNNTDCVLVLEAPPGHLIKLDFRDYFHIEPSPGCKNDFLEIRDGAHGYSDLLKKICGREFPPVLTSSDRHLWINFKSDDSIEYAGFKAVFEYIPRPLTLSTPEIMPCQINMADLEEGFLAKSNISSIIMEYTSKHNMPIDCVWAITVREAWRIQLQFKTFDLNKPNECEKNFVQVFSPRTHMKSQKSKFCGSIADTVSSETNIMYVRFFANYEAYESNFEANFTAYREHDKSPDGNQGCTDEEFDCEDATCISNTLRCNGRYNCRFRWDEDDCQGGLSAQSLSLTDDHIIIIMVIFSLILSGMCFTFIFNCVKKLIRDHRAIQEPLTYRALQNSYD